LKDTTMIDFQPPTVEVPKVSRPSSRRLAFAAGLAVILASAGIAARQQWLHPIAPAAADSAAPPVGVPVSVAEVQQRDTTVWTEFSGRLEAVDRVEIRPRVTGAIIEARFREGALVRQGDVLFTIDPAPYRAEVDRLQAQVEAAEARLVLATREQQRGFQLGHTNDLAQRDVDTRVNEFNAATANLRGAQAALETARLNLDWTAVRAPISGRVGKIEVTQGNLVGAGPTAPVMTTLVSVDPIYASFEADEQSVARVLATLPPGRDVVSGLDRVPVQMGTLASEGTPLHGRLQLIDNVVDTRSGTVRVRAAFDNPDGRLMPGQFARVRMSEATTVPAIAIDERAIGTDQDRRFVMVVGGDGRVASRTVQLGGMADGLRIVTSGLRPGERIVVNGLQRIRSGSLVAPRLVTMAAVAGNATDLR
jgi:multidrug efflux system membrane fusion protein